MGLDIEKLFRIKLTPSQRQRAEFFMELFEDRDIEDICYSFAALEALYLGELSVTEQYHD